MPTAHGTFRVRAYRDRSTGADHVAWIKGEPADGAIVRVHSECLTGEAFGSLKCECGPQLQSALETIDAEGGVVVYLRGHEGRGIGLINKLKAYHLQEEGFDTLDANLQLGLPADARDYGAATAILKDLGISRVRLLSNNPEKARQLRGARRRRSPTWCRSSSASASSTRATSTRSATGWGTRCPTTRVSTRPGSTRRLDEAETAA